MQLLVIRIMPTKKKTISISHNWSAETYSFLPMEYSSKYCSVAKFVKRVHHQQLIFGQLEYSECLILIGLGFDCLSENNFKRNYIFICIKLFKN